MDLNNAIDKRLQELNCTFDKLDEIRNQVRKTQEWSKYLPKNSKIKKEVKKEIKLLRNKRI